MARIWMPNAIVVPSGVVAAKAGSVWIGARLPVPSAKWSTSAWVTVCHPLTPIAWPARASRSAGRSMLIGIAHADTEPGPGRRGTPGVVRWSQVVELDAAWARRHGVMSRPGERGGKAGGG